MTKFTGYRVVYQFRDGSTLSSPWTTATVDINDLRGLSKFTKILSVTPITIEYGESISETEIRKICYNDTISKQQESLVDLIDKLNIELQAAKCKLTELGASIYENR